MDQTYALSSATCKKLPCISPLLAETARAADRDMGTLHSGRRCSFFHGAGWSTLVGLTSISEQRDRILPQLTHQIRGPFILPSLRSHCQYLACFTKW
jgi:hypothetical protein